MPWRLCNPAPESVLDISAAERLELLRGLELHSLQGRLDRRIAHVCRFTFQVSDMAVSNGHLPGLQSNRTMQKTNKN